MRLRLVKIDERERERKRERETRGLGKIARDTNPLSVHAYPCGLI